MAGRMGHERVTVKNLEVVDVGQDYVAVKGLVPGPINSFLILKKRGEDKKFVPMYKEVPKIEEKKMEVKDAS
jgi:ribosomal protein L3